MKCTLIISLLLAAVGILLVVAGAVFKWYALPTIIHNKVVDLVPLKQNNSNGWDDTTEKWVNPPYELAMQFWIFDVQNPLAVERNGHKPVLLQKGPYGYVEVQKKHQVTFHDDGKHVTYFNDKTYYWNETLSCDTCTPDDMVTVPNLLINNMLSNMTAIAAEPLAALLSPVLAAAKESLYVTKSVREILFEGYSDPIISLLNAPAFRTITKKLDIPERIGLFFGKNDTNDGEYLIKTGIGNVDDVGQIIEWQNQVNDTLAPLLPSKWWTDKYARMINGTDGTLYKPFVDKEYQPYIFVSDIARSIWVTYKQDIEDKGIPAMRFTVPRAVFAATGNNIGFCHPRKRRVYQQDVKDPRTSDANPGYCLPDGLLDVSIALNAPIIISSPHFLYSTSDVINGVVGVEPNEAEHETVIDLEPHTGVGVNFARRLQLNALVLNSSGIVPLQRLHSLVHPIAWLNESAKIDSNTRSQLKNQLVDVISLASTLCYIAIVVGAIMVIVACIGFAVHCAMSKKSRVGSAENRPVDTMVSEATTDTKLA